MRRITAKLCYRLNEGWHCSTDGVKAPFDVKAFPHRTGITVSETPGDLLIVAN